MRDPNDAKRHLRAHATLPIEGANPAVAPAAPYRTGGFSDTQGVSL